MALITLYILLALILLWIVVDSLRAGISPMPSSVKARKAICNLIPKETTGPFVDLGSGWGDLAIALADSFPKTHVIGYELSFIPYLISKWRSPKNVQIYRTNFFHHSLPNCQVVVCYLYPAAMERLRPKLEQELSPGSFVISHTFAIPNWIPLKIVELDDLYHTKIYLYQRTV